MNRTKKLRGGDNLTFNDRKELAQLSILKLIAYRVKIELDNLRSKINDYYRSKIIEKDDLLNIDKLVHSEYHTYIDSFKTSNDAIEAIQRAKGMKSLEKHYNNVKGIAALLLQTIDQEKELKKSKGALTSAAVLPPPPVTNPVAPPSQLAQALVAQTSVAPVIQDPSNIIGNLLAEIDILKSELISKDIILEETNKKLVTAFYFLSENEANASRTNVNSVSSDELDALRQTTAEEIERYIKVNEVQATHIAELEGINKGKDAELTELRGQLKDINAENEELRKKSGEDNATIAGLQAQIIQIQNPPANPNEARLRELEEKNARLNAENTEIQRQINEINGENEKLTAELGDARAHIAALDAELGDARARIEELAAKISRMGQVDVDLAIARRDMRQVEAELADKIANIAQLEPLLNNSTDHIKQLETELAVTIERIAELDRLLGDATDVNAKLQPELGLKTNLIAKLQAELGIATARIEELEGVQVVKHTQLQQENEALRKKIGELEREVSKLKQDIVDLEAQAISTNNLGLSSERVSSESVSSESLPSVNLDETFAQKQKVIDFKLIVRHTLFNDLKVLIENIKQNNKYDIISSLNEIINSFNQLYPTNKIQKLSKPSNTKEINKKINELYLIIKTK